MPQVSYQVLPVLASLLLLHLTLRVLVRKRYSLPLPPGPRTLPLVGSLLEMPAERQWEIFQQWGEVHHSDIIHIQVARTSIIVLNSADAISELLELRSASYSDRPRFIMAVELSGWDWSFAAMEYGDSWREHRKMMHGSFNVDAVQQYRPQMTLSTHNLLRRLLAGTVDAMDELRQLAAETIMDVTYGIEIQAKDDPYMRIVHQALRGVTEAAAPGRFWVDQIPLLRYVPAWMPGAEFQRKAAEWRREACELREVPFQETLRNMAKGTAKSSFVADRLPTSESGGAGESEVLQNTAAVVYAAGGDTTVAALGWFVIAMLKYPDVQRKAQLELDTVLGHGIMPRFEDKPLLPYTMAIVMEVLRWRPVAPLGVIHKSSLDRDDQLRGYRIPARTQVIGNIWAVCHNEYDYPDPSAFSPGRFLLEGQLNPAIRDPQSLVFGSGRRICPGRHLAVDAIWLSVASILAMLKLEKSVDENGRAVEPGEESFPGIVLSPRPFRCRFTPRSEQTERAVQATGEN